MKIMLRRILILILVITCSGLACRNDSQSAQTPQPTQPQAQTLVVAAASDLTKAFEELGKEYQRTTNQQVTFSFGSTGLLAKQIEQGAPMDLFAAANVEFIDKLAEKGLIIADTKALYARGRVTIWRKADSPIEINKIEDLTNPQIKRIAIANPEHAPYGVAAKEAMQKAGVWGKVSEKIVYGENISQTFQFAQTGNADVALVSLSLSIGSDGKWLVVPQELHKPVDQALAVIKSSKQPENARKFAAYVNSPEGRIIMRKYGFTLPGEEETK